jgi:hypothetical protein
MNTIDIKGKTYRVNKLGTLQQFHVARRLAPLLAAAGITMSMLKARDSGMPAFDDFAPVMGPVAHILSQMSDSDSNYIIFTCLSCVQRQSGSDNRWAAVATGDQMMFEDIAMPVMLRLVWAVVQDNILDFLQELEEETPSPSS